VARLTLASRDLAEALLGEAGGTEMRRATGSPADAAALAFHKKDDPSLSCLHLHSLFPMGAIATYASAFTGSKVCRDRTVSPLHSPLNSATHLPRGMHRVRSSSCPIRGYGLPRRPMWRRRR